jgi:aldehyde:ferredoxin oxidoreductase
VHETIQRMQDRHGQDVEVTAIGPAGENLVRFACWINSDDRASGRGGSGAVAGSKNLKCIVIKGDRKNVPRRVDPAAFSQANDDCPARLRACETTNPRDGDLRGAT